MPIVLAQSGKITNAHLWEAVERAEKGLIDADQAS